jgi:hypothetical protein
MTNTKGHVPMRDFGVDEKIILKCVSYKYG